MACVSTTNFTLVSAQSGNFTGFQIWRGSTSTYTPLHRSGEILRAKVSPLWWFLGWVSTAELCPGASTCRPYTVVSIFTEKWIMKYRTSFSIFTRATPVSAGISCRHVSVCPSVCSFDTNRCSTETVKRRITQTTPHDSTGTLVFWCRKSPQKNQTRSSNEGAQCRWTVGRLKASAVAANWRL